jgi:protein SCO1/2
MTARRNRLVPAFALALGLAAVAAGGVLAHEDHRHDAEAPADPAWQPGGEGPAAVPFDLDIGGPFELVDHTGRTVSDEDFLGQVTLVFFGYARCEGICPLGLRRMTEAVDLLGEAGREVRPVLITIDPDETPAVLAKRVAEIHPRLAGLTGTPAQLDAAAKAYHVDSERVGHAIDGSPVFQHGSYIYLMGPKGTLQSVLPPVLPAGAMAEVLRRHLPASGADAE